MNNECVKVSIIDEDIFFVHGLKKIIENYYISLGVNVEFIPPRFGVSVNLLFQYISGVRGRKLHENGKGSFIEFVRFFTIIDSPKCSKSKPSRVFSCDVGEINKKMSIAEVIECLSISEKSEPRTINTPSHRAITEREWSIIDCFSQEMSTKKIAKLLKISGKTVSSHKYSVMKKLGFNRSYDFYYWVRSLEKNRL
ncbi:hypothetical protein SME20J_35450 [Serratia marcescens]|nr:hypothetical protein SME20J_35450 [Serratia marcescens]